MSESMSLAATMPGKPKRPGWIIPTITALAVIAIAGVGGTIYVATRSAEPAPVAATTTLPPTAAAPAGPAKDVIALEACAAMDLSSSDDISAMKAIGAKAATSGDTSIRLAGLLVRDSAALAEAAVGHSDAKKMLDFMVDNAHDLMKTCRTYGYA